MAERRPIVLVGGEFNELPSGDTLPSVLPYTPTFLDTASTSYTLLQASFDGKTILRSTHSAAQVFTVPPSITVSETIQILQWGAGSLSIAAGVGVTINSANSALTFRTQFSMASLIPTGSDEYLLVGDLIVGA